MTLRPLSNRLQALLSALFVVLLTAALCDLPAPAHEPWHTLLFTLTLCLGAALALRAIARAATGAPLRFSPIWALWLVLGQFFGTRVGFPSVRFDMFTQPAAAEQTHYIYRALHASGAVRAFEPGPLLPTLGYSRLVRGLHDHMAALESMRAQALPPAEVAKAEQRVREVVLATLRIYNGQKPADPIQRLDVLRAHWRSTQPSQLDVRARILEVALP